MHEPSPGVGPTSSRQVIGQAIQRLTAARLGRGFVPLALLALAGVVKLLAAGPGAGSGWVLVGGAVATGGAMLAFGLRNVQLAFGREARPWMTGAMVGSLIPPAFTLYAFGWLGLREIAVGSGFSGRLAGVAVALLGLWALRAWMQVVEVQNLARAMALPVGREDGGTA